MGRLLDLAKNLAGEKSLSGAFGRWILEVSGNGDLIPGMQAEIDALQAQNVVPDGTYANQLLIWNGTEWVPQPDYSAQTTWYVNASTGSDSNDGSAGSPLASFVEFQRRMSGYVLRTVYTVNVTGDLAELPVDFDIGPGGYLDIIFAVTTGASYTVNAYTPANPAGTAEVDKIQTVAAGTAAGLVGKRIRFTSGPATNCTAWATRALAGYDDHTFEMTQAYSFTRQNGTWIQAAPAAGNTFVEETLPVVSAMSVHIRRQGGQGFCFAIRNAQFGAPGSPIQDPIFEVEGWGSTVGCAWYSTGFQTDGYHVSDGFKQGCVLRGLAPSPIDKARFFACYMNGTFLLSSVLFYDSIFKHGAVVVEGGDVHFVGLVGIMLEAGDAVADAVTLYDASCRLIVNTAGEADGYLLILNQTGFAFKISPGAVVNYTVKPICSTGGGANYAQVGGTTRALSTDVPYIEVASNAAIIAGMNGTLGP